MKANLKTSSLKLNHLQGWLADSEFASAVNALPLVSVDLVVVNPTGQILLGLRRNAPARHWWFTPGGRVRKNEPFADCLRRVAMSELALQDQDVKGAQLMGVWDHFYEDSAYSAEVSTHYVNLPHVLQQDKPQDYVIATGVQYSVREFTSKTAHQLGVTLSFEGEGVNEVAKVAAITGDNAPALEVGQVVVRVDPRYFRPTEVETLLGDPSKAKQHALLKQHGFDVAVGVER